MSGMPAGPQAIRAHCSASPTPPSFPNESGAYDAALSRLLLQALPDQHGAIAALLVAVEESLDIAIQEPV